MTQHSPGGGSQGGAGVVAAVCLDEALDELAEHFEEHVAPRGIGVVVVAEHTCMTLRGARAGGSRAVTTAVRGVLGENGQEREEFLASTRQLARSDRRQA